MYFVFKRVLLHISTHILAPRHSFSYTFQKVFFKDELFSVNVFLLFIYLLFLLSGHSIYEHQAYIDRSFLVAGSPGTLSIH